MFRADLIFRTGPKKMSSTNHEKRSDKVNNVKQKHTQNPFKHQRWSFYPLTVFAKISILDVWLGSEYTSVYNYKKLSVFALFYKQLTDIYV